MRAVPLFSVSIIGPGPPEKHVYPSAVEGRRGGVGIDKLHRLDVADLQVGLNSREDILQIVESAKVEGPLLAAQIGQRIDIRRGANSGDDRRIGSIQIPPAGDDPQWLVAFGPIGARPPPVR